MAFNIAGFIRVNKRFFIWAVFFSLLFLMRGMFGLIFLTYILCFIFNGLIERLSARTPLPRRLWTVIIYLTFLTLLVALGAVVAPTMGAESTIFFKQLPHTIDQFHDYLDKQAAAQPNLSLVYFRLKHFLSLERLLGMDGQTVTSIFLASFNRVTHYFSFFLLGTLFSFFILFDFPNLKARARALKNTRLKEIYEETADSVVQFALVVGAAFQAQIMIAWVNTALTALGLYLLNIEPVALLSAIVFFCGLIPVLGVFISSAPILLLAFNSGGAAVFSFALLMILIVHLVEAYILNPRIFSAVFKINPVLTLIILYLGHKFLGLWGVVLGIPITVYLYRYAILGKTAWENPLEGPTSVRENESGDAAPDPAEPLSGPRDPE
ncbi:MAG: AI-2E family transporter [Pseudomonadota bacterium]